MKYRNHIWAYVTLFLLLTFWSNKVQAQTPAGQTIANQASVKFQDVGLAQQTRLSNTVTTTVLGRARLSIALLASANPAAVGDTLIYEIAMTNIGNITANGILISGDLRNTSVVFLNANNNGQFSDDQVLWNTPITLAPGQKVTRIINVRVLDNASPDLGLTSHATATAQNAEQVTTTLQVPVGRAPNLIIDKQANKTSITSGEMLTYTLTYTNKGNLTVNQVRLTDDLPNSLTYISAEPQPQQTGNLLTWTVGNLTPGQTGRIILQAQVLPNRPTGQILNRITAFGTVTTPNQTNTPYTVTSPINQVALITSPLMLAKTVSSGADSLIPGATLNYRIAVQNPGGSSIERLTLRDTLDSALELLSVNTNAAVQTSGRIIELVWTPFPANGQTTIEIATRVLPNAPTPATIQNRAWLNHPGGILSSQIVKTPLVLPQEFDGKIVQSPALFAGQFLTIQIQDGEYNTSPNKADILPATATNARTGETETITLTETGDDTGEFSITLPTGFGQTPGTNNDGRMLVAHQDIIRTTYTDEKNTTSTSRQRTAETRIRPTAITLTPEPATLVANGTDRSIFTARITDERGNPLPDGTPVQFFAEQGTFSGNVSDITGVVSGGNGEAKVTYTAPVLSSSGTVQIRASFEGFDSDNVNLEVLPGAIGIRVFDAEKNADVTGTDPDLNVNVTLSGTTVTGDPIDIQVAVDANGLFVVPDIPPGTYQLKSIVREVATARVVSQSALQTITVNFDGSATPPKNAISGTVKGKNEESGARYAGSTVELLDLQGQVVASAILDAEGRYDFQGLDPGDFQLQVTFPDGRKVSQEVPSRSQLVGEVLVNTNILIDPFGTVFDSETGAVIPNAIVTLRTLTEEVLPIPLLNGTGATPNLDNINPFSTTSTGQYAFLFGGDQVGAVGNPIKHLMTVEPPVDSPYLPRRFNLTVEPSRPGPVDQVPITMQVTSADGLEMALPNSFTLTPNMVNVPNIETIAFNIPLFQLRPVLSFTKTAQQDTVQPGDAIDFQFFLTNVGNDTARSLTVSDTLPSGLGILSAPNATSPVAGVAHWTLSDLPPGKSDTLTLRAEVLPNQEDGAQQLNRAWATFTDGLPIPAQTSVYLRVRPNLTLTKTANQDSIVAGQTVIYTLTYTNTGTAPALAMTLVDTLPNQLIPISAPNATIEGQRIVWEIGDIAPNANAVYTLTAQATDSLQIGQTILNRAHLIDANGKPSTSAQHSAITRTARLVLYKQTDVDTIQAGGELAYMLRVHNEGGPITNETTLTDPLPEGLEFVSATGTPTVNNNTVTWTLPTLANGQQDTFNLITRVTSENAQLTNTASLSNNTTGASFVIAQASTSVFTTQANTLQLVKTADRPIAQPGETITYHIEALVPLQPLTTVTIHDTLSNKLVFDSFVSSHTGTYDENTHVLSWTLNNLNPNEPQTIRFTTTPASTLSPGEHPIDNVATATDKSETIRSNPATVVLSVPFFTIDKIADQTVAEPGDFVNYHITLTNLSEADTLHNIAIYDQLPYGFSLVAGTPLHLNVGKPLITERPSTNQLQWHLPSVAPGRKEHISYRVVIGTDAESGNGINQATASATTPTGHVLSVGPARVKVRIKTLAFTQGEAIIGKAWIDHNLNDKQDNKEPTVPNIVLVMEDGTRIEADNNGQYSIPDVKPGDHVLRLLPTHIPKNLEPLAPNTRAAGDPWTRFVYVPQSGLAKINFAFREIPSPSVTPPQLPKWSLTTTAVPDTFYIAGNPIQIKTFNGPAFAPNHALPSSIATQQIKLLAQHLATLSGPIRITGHADSRKILNPHRNNNVLSFKRAESIRKIFEQAGIAPNRITTFGKGDQRPIASNKTTKGRAQNRRVEIAYWQGISHTLTIERTTTATLTHAPFQGHIEMVDSLDTPLTYVLESATQTPRQNNKTLAWSIDNIQQDQPFSVTYQLKHTGTLTEPQSLTLSTRLVIHPLEKTPQIKTASTTLVILPKFTPIWEVTP